jgi:hypothetical protein
LASFGHFWRQWRAALEQAQAVCTLADEHGLPLWRLWATTLEGAAMVEEGQTRDDRQLLTRGLEEMRAAGAGITRTQTWPSCTGLCALHGAPPRVDRNRGSAGFGRNGWRTLLLAELNLGRRESFLILHPSNNTQAEQCFREECKMVKVADRRRPLAHANRYETVAEPNG